MKVLVYRIQEYEKVLICNKCNKEMQYYPSTEEIEKRNGFMHICFDCKEIKFMFDKYPYKESHRAGACIGELTYEQHEFYK